MTHRPRPRDRLLGAAAPWLLALALFATSMGVAATLREAPAPDGGRSPAPGTTTRPGDGDTEPYAGPDVMGVFMHCSPACDLVVATEGIGRRLTFTDRAIDESAPSLSPDGVHVIFRCGEPAVEPGGGGSPRPAGLGSLCLLDTAAPEEGATPAPADVIRSAPDVDYGSPRISPDGQLFAFDFRTAGGEAGIAIWDVDEDEPTTVASSVLNPDLGDVSNPAWSPDGSTLAFQCGVLSMPSGNNAVRFCAMPRDGGPITRLGGIEGDCGSPTFAPDAEHLAVVCVVPGAEGGDLFFLAMSEPMGQSITGSQRIAPEGEKRVAFSSDGTYVYVRRGDELWALNPATEAWSLPPLPPLHGDFDLIGSPG